MKTYLTTILLILSFSFAFANEKTPVANTNTTTLLSHEVFFNTDSHTITNEEFSKLITFIKTIETVDIDRVSVHGFTDDRGSYNYNLKLSNKRANAIKTIVANYVTANNASKVEIAGKGEVELSTQAKNLFTQLRSLNRKVVVVVSPKKLVAGSFYGSDLRAGKIVSLPTLKFQKGLRYITNESTQTLRDLAAYLVANKGIYFTVQGHVCCTKGGADSRNKETGKKNLSEVRAKFIHDYLVKQGVAASRIKYEGLKGTKNLGGDDSNDRRVELFITNIK